MIEKKEGDDKISGTTVFNKSVVFILVLVATLFLNLSFVLSEDIDIELNYEIIDTSSNNIIVSILEPDLDDVYDLSLLNLEFKVFANISNNISCNIELDDELIFAHLVNDSKTYNTIKTLVEELDHTLLVECGEENNFSLTAVTKDVDFIIDYIPPTMTLITSDAEVFNEKNVTLSFIVNDNYFNLLQCDLNVYDDNGQTIRVVSIPSVTAAELSEVELINLNDGEYEWKVSCTDDVENYAESITKSFLINSNNIDMELNKDVYDLGESGILTIESAQDAEVTLIITDPLLNITTIEYVNEIIKVIPLTFNNYGKYNFKLYVILNGEQTNIEMDVNVINLMTIDIDVGNATVKKDEKIIMNVVVDNAISTVTYRWDFGDGKTAIGSTVEHTYIEEEVYEVTVTATDSHGNKIDASDDVEVFDVFSLTVIVENALEELVRDAEVFFGDEKLTTGVLGEVIFENLYGEEDLIVMADTYESFIVEEYEIDENKELVVSLKKNEEEVVVKVIKTKDAENEVNNNPDLKAVADLLDKIENKLDYINIMDTENHKIAQYLNLESSLMDAKVEIGQFYWDMKYLVQNKDTLSLSDYNAQKAEIDDDIEKIKDVTLMSLYPSSQSKDTKDIDKSMIIDVTGAYSKGQKIDNKLSKSILSANKRIMEEYSIELSSNEITLEYLSGKNSKVTLFTAKVLTDLEKEGLLLLLSFGDSLKNDNKVIKTLTSSKEIVDDSLYSINIEKRDMAVFYIENDFKSESVDLIVAYNYKDFNINQVPKITGFAFLGDILMFDNNMISMEILVIVLLVLGYLAYEFSWIKKIKKFLLLRDVQIKKIHDEILSMSKDLKDISLDSAAKKYELIMKLYSKLSADKKKVIKHLVDGIYFEYVIVQINQSVKEVKKFIKNDDVDIAQDKYDEIKDLYKQLPKQFRGVVLAKCKSIFAELETLLSD